MNKLNEAIVQLNRYLNIKSSADMIKHLLEPDIDQSNKDLEHANKLNELILSILSIQSEAKFVDSICSDIDAYISGQSQPTEKLAKRLKNKPNTSSEEDGAPFYVTRYDQSGGKYGYDRPVSVLEILGEQNPAAGTASHGRKISIIEIADAKLNFNNRDCSGVSTFLQVLPSVEISRAVPYFDCKIITRSAKATAEEVVPVERLFANGVSIGSFLNGQVTEGGTSPESQYLLAKISSEDLIDKNVLNNMEKKKPSDIASSASMELFLSPQTMVNGNASYTDVDTTNYGGASTIPKDKLVMDKFRPLMTWESFNLSVAPASGMISTKTADVKLKLHDRSRMNEIAPLVVPARTGDTELQIHWGWSHPDPTSPYGALINSMRVKEIYGVMNSSYTFTPEGQVDITLKLYTKGAQNIAFDLLKGNSSGDEHPVDALNETVRALREAISKLRGEGYDLKDDLGAPDTLGKATSVKGMLSLTSDEIKELQKFQTQLGKITTKSSGQVFSDLSNMFEKAFQSKEDFSTAQTKSIQAAIDKMFNSQDPYLATPQVGVPTNRLSITHKTHVSFAKFLIHMVGQQLLNTKKFEEVQFIFYPMNEWAMWAKDYNIGQYPMSKAMLESMFKEEFAKSPTMRIQTLLNIVRKLFMNNVGDDIYGFGEFYDTKNKLELKKEYQDDQKKKQGMAVKKNEIMDACYGPGVRKFKKPNISMFIETAKTAEGQSVLRLHFTDRNCTSYSSYADLWNSLNKSSMGAISKRKKQLVKRNSTPPKNMSAKEKKKWEAIYKDNEERIGNHEQVYNEALKRFTDLKIVETIGNSGKYKLNAGPNKLRGLLASNVPTLKYGTEFSGIITANLSTQSNPQMESIHMVRQKTGSKPNVPGEASMPMQVRPAQLTLDTFGCPLVNFGQQFFVDFNTNSTIDDMYAVTGVSHSLSPGDFKTNIKLVPLQRLGSFGTLVDTLNDIKDEADQAAKQTKP